MVFIALNIHHFPFLTFLPPASSECAQWRRKDKMQQEELNILRMSLDKSEQKVKLSRK